MAQICIDREHAHVCAAVKQPILLHEREALNHQRHGGFTKEIYPGLHRAKKKDILVGTQGALGRGNYSLDKSLVAEGAQRKEANEMPLNGCQSAWTKLICAQNCAEQIYCGHLVGDWTEKIAVES
jgi:hypothetical protein